MGGKVFYDWKSNVWMGEAKSAEHDTNKSITFLDVSCVIIGAIFEYSAIRPRDKNLRTCIMLSHGHCLALGGTYCRWF